jgi:hypothetical protein
MSDKHTTIILREVSTHECAVDIPDFFLRDYFAGQALAGILANLPCDIPTRLPWETRELYLAFAAYDLAGAMMQARKEQS